MDLAMFLGRPVSNFLENVPFKDWYVERDIEDELDNVIIHYVFTQNGLELRCDYNDIVNVIFLYSEEYNGFDDALINIHFTWKREQVLNHFGLPEKSGEKKTDSILGKIGAWDRFVFPEYGLHIEYKIDKDTISKITLMQTELIPY
ncbi:MAG TPA: hypothetical protein VHO70_06755 [Chitinispirillaceae bacterium]|nr:hypothetical protein [Chitinispirillaceae bacterium]